MGTYISNTGSTSCVTCPSGYSYNQNTGSTTFVGLCLPCPEGTYIDPVLNSCVPCLPGTYTVDKKVCLSCASGKFTAEYGSTTCSMCPPGRYSTSGASTCTECSPGSYSSAMSSTCTACN